MPQATSDVIGLQLENVRKDIADSKSHHIGETLLVVGDNPEVIGRNAYLAGLIDGEGCIYAVKRGRTLPGRPERFTYCLTLEMAMCSKETIFWVAENFGGRVCVQKSRTNRPYYHWRITNDSAVEVLKKVYPFMVTKKQQAALAFKFREVIKQSAWQRDSHRNSLRDELILKIRSLNQRWTLTKTVETSRGTPEMEMIQSELQGDLQRPLATSAA